MLAAGRRSGERSSAALATLCETYWYPVYAFIRRQGNDADAARDLTQEFFTRVLEKDYFGQARKERGRFRSFLLSSVRHFLSNQRDWDQAQKRGGAFEITSLPTEIPEPEQVSDVADLERLGLAIDQLAELDPGLAQLVDLKFFCGYTLNEIADMRSISKRTVQRDWEKARLLLQRALQGRGLLPD